MADELATETRADEVRTDRRLPSRTTQARARAKPGSVLAARAATEYVYVGRDLRRIAVVSIALVVIMLAAWLLIVVLGVIPLDFY
jgi:hypothetical protein